MGVIERAPGENGTGQKRLKSQKVAKGPLTEAAPVAKGPKGARRTEELVPAVG